MINQQIFNELHGPYPIGS